MKALILGVAMIVATGCASQPQEEIIGTWEEVDGEIITHYYPEKEEIDPIETTLGVVKFLFDVGVL